MVPGVYFTGLHKPVLGKKREKKEKKKKKKKREREREKKKRERERERENVVFPWAHVLLLPDDF